MNRTILVLITFLMTGCAGSGYFFEGQRIDPSEGYVAIQPHYSFGSRQVESVNLELIRIEADGKRSLEFYRGVRVDTPSILKLKPGFYYLSYLGEEHSGGGSLATYNYALNWRLSLFEVKSGQLNYPGDWEVRSVVVDSTVEGSMAGGSVTIVYEAEAVETQNPKIESAVRSLFPSIASKFPMVYTKIKAPDEKKG